MVKSLFTVDSKGVFFLLVVREVLFFTEVLNWGPQNESKNNNFSNDCISTVISLLYRSNNKVINLFPIGNGYMIFYPLKNSSFP